MSQFPPTDKDWRWKKSKDPKDKLLPVHFQSIPAAKKIMVEVGGKPFIEYRYHAAIKKPVLFPVMAADGTVVTRGFPLEPHPGEPVDHPHHTGHWLNHGVVNGVDFWTSTAEADHAEDKVHGAIVHRQTSQKQEGKKGRLSIIADWITDRQDTLLVETTTFVFSGTVHTRTIDRVTTLTAKNEAVTFEDSKEGMMALRVAPFLEQPSDTPQKVVDRNGQVSGKEMINQDARRKYSSSEGLEGDAVWGTRARWVALSAEKENTPYVVVIMDHPDNVNHPTHWMARGYGLFAANPLGSAAYTNGQEVLNFTLKPGVSATFTYRILIQEGKKLSEASINQQYEQFSKELRITK